MADTKTHILPFRNYMYVGAALLLLTMITVSAAQFDFGSWNIAIALSIAAIKASLVALFFMHLKYDNKMYALIFLMAILFLALFITLTMFDTSQRGRLYPITENPIRQYAAIYNPNGDIIPANERFQDASGRIVSSDFFLKHGYGPFSRELVIDPINDELALEGKEIFNKTCYRCHRLDERYTGPPLRGVVAYRSPTFIMNMILNPEENVRRHPDVKALQKRYYTIMTNQDMSIDNARAVLEYLRYAIERDGEQKL